MLSNCKTEHASKKYICTFFFHGIVVLKHFLGGENPIWVPLLSHTKLEGDEWSWLVYVQTLLPYS